MKEIGRHKYASLKLIKDLSDTEKKQVEVYEAKYKVIYKPIKREPTPIKEGPVLDKASVFRGFERSFEIIHEKEFKRTTDAVKNLEPVVKYFANDPTFKDSNRLIKRFGNTKLEPSFKKGLLILGHSGNGKTAIMDSIQHLFNEAFLKSREFNWDTRTEWSDKRFLRASSVEVSMEYEQCINGFEKSEFFNRYEGYRYFFDDIGREHISNNYGKRDVFRDLLFKRNEKGTLTHATMNYSEGTDCIETTLHNLGRRYGSHIFDRLFEMFNIIEFKGKSFRI